MDSASEGWRGPFTGGPPSQARARGDQQGETYDFEFTPTTRGQLLRIEVRGLAATSSLLARLPVKVE